MAVENQDGGFMCRAALWACAIALIVGGWGCKRDNATRIAVIPKGTTHEFWKSVEEGAKKAGKDFGVEIIWKGPLKEDEKNQQIGVVEQFISEGVSGICLAPLDDTALLAPVQAARLISRAAGVDPASFPGIAWKTFQTSAYKTIPMVTNPPPQGPSGPRTMIWSPEFWSRDAYRAKIKTPFELVVSTARATGSDVDTPLPLVQWIARIGEPLYQCQPPTGYADKAEAWVNTGALLNRLNYSLALAGNKMRGARTDVASLLGMDSSTDAKVALDRAVQVFLGGQAAPTTVETLQKQLENPQVLRAKLDDPQKQVDLGVVAGLVLGAPEFQRR